jgi:hypothetical protein
MRVLVYSTLVVVATAASVWSQTLADLAKKEEERRKHTAPAGKVYTNKDLGAVPPAPPAPAAGTAAGSDAKAAPAKDGDKGTPGATGAGGEKGADQDKAAGGAKDQKYWRDRMKAALEAVDRDQTLADAMQSRINALTTDFVNRDDPAQRTIIARDRDRALAELDRLKKQIVEDKKAITDVEEEARRAGVPPGWLR